MVRSATVRSARAGLQRFYVIVLPLILLLSGEAVSFRVAKVQHQAELERTRESVRAELEPVRGALSRELFGALHLTEGVAAMVTVEGGTSSDRLSALARELVLRSDVIRHVAVAPRNVVTYVYPLEGNERVLGFDYASSPEQSSSVERMMVERRIVVAGPLELVQGGKGVIGRSPIYLQERANGVERLRYWGLASTVIDFQKLLTKTRLSEPPEHIRLALRGVDGLGARGKIFWGDNSVFEASPVSMDVPLPAGSWQLAGVPRAGWSRFSLLDSNHFHIGNLLTLVLSVLLFKLLNLSDLREREIAERREAEAAIQRANRALRLFSLVKGAVVRATDERGLLAEVCRIAVESAGYRMAWIGRCEKDEQQTIRPITHCGPGEGFLERIHVSWGDNPLGHGTAGRAIRSRAPAVARELRQHPDFAPWYDVLATRDFASAIAVPLSVAGQVFGVLLIYAAEPDAFDNTEIELLEDLGNTILHGMAALQLQSERDDAMTALETARTELERRVKERTQELQVAKDAAESADHLKTSFLSTMSHELRTPLNSIIGFTGILLEGLAGELNPEQSKQLRMVQTSAQRLLALITEVLDISKIEAGQLTLASESISVQDVVQGAVASIKPAAARKGAFASASSLANRFSACRATDGDSSRSY
jgi:sensor domain CHASE-containing protein/GAF domain-containing protein